MCYRGRMSTRKAMASRRTRGLQQDACYGDVRLILVPYAEDFAGELNERAPLTSTVTRLVNLDRGSGLDLETFLARLLPAGQSPRNGRP